mgnify:CR=1 FL=1
MKKILLKFKQFFSYFINKKTRKYFFVLIIRKFKNILFKEEIANQKYWINKNVINHKKFYRIHNIRYKNFFLEQKRHYLAAKNKYKSLRIKMGGMADLNLLYNVTKKIEPNNILETGVAFGWSTLAFSLAKTKKTKISSVDLPYPFKNSHHYVAKALPNDFKKKIKFYFGIDTDILKKINLTNKKFDLIHYDSDKSFDGRKKNYEIIWKMLKKKGWFISDDISDNSAFESFVKNLKIKKYYVLQCDGKFVGIAIKN